MKKAEGIDKVLNIGLGLIVIDQAYKFDHSGTETCKASRSAGYQIVLVNSDPATIMTCPGMAGATHVEPLAMDKMEKIVAREQPQGWLPNPGVQDGPSRLKSNRGTDGTDCDPDHVPSRSGHSAVVQNFLLS
jgi:carbamoyl-phosphate synthase large subunit